MTKPMIDKVPEDVRTESHIYLLLWRDIDKVEVFFPILGVFKTLKSPSGKPYHTYDEVMPLIESLEVAFKLDEHAREDFYSGIYVKPECSHKYIAQYLLRITAEQLAKAMIIAADEERRNERIARAKQRANAAS